MKREKFKKRYIQAVKARRIFSNFKVEELRENYSKYSTFAKAPRHDYKNQKTEIIVADIPRRKLILKGN